MPPRDGHKQRKAAEELASVQCFSSSMSQPPDEHSALWVLLMKKWSGGVISASDVQEFASAALASGCTATDLKTLALLGPQGQSPQNCHGDLIRYWCVDLISPVFLFEN